MTRRPRNGDRPMIPVRRGPRPRWPLAAIAGRDLDPARPVGLRDPAYVPDTPHDLWMASQGQGYRSTLSAEELEASIRTAPALEELRDLHPLNRDRYDGTGRLIALRILEHVALHPQDAKLPDVMRREVRKVHPELDQLIGESTCRWLWAVAAAARIHDAHELDG